MTPSVWADPPDVSASVDHVDSKGRLCFYPAALAKVLYQFEECKLRLKLAGERGTEHDAAIEEACRVKVEAAEKWCSGKVELVHVAYMEQVKIASRHCGELVKELTTNCAEQVRTAARMAPKNVRPKFWKTPEFWGPVAAVLGLTAGVFVGYAYAGLK